MTPHPPHSPRSALALWLFLAYGAFVVYGSLVPLAYQPLPFDVALERFQRIPFLKLGIESRADWVANGVLYLPLGFLATRAAVDLALPRAAAALLAMALCCAWAVGVEFTQLYFPGRTVSQNDIWAECIGSVLGAMSALLLASWVDRLRQAWRLSSLRLLPRLLELYAVVYVLLCFFPYDLLLSMAEIEAKARSDGWGWMVVNQGRGWFLFGLQWVVEVALAMPIGALPFFRRASATGGTTARTTARTTAAAVCGLALGLFIEIGQFFVNSGVSQGASVLSRGLGLALGAAAVPWLRSLGWNGLRRVASTWAPWLWLPYVLTLSLASGAFRHSWQGPDQAWASWQTTQLLPFYYHYFTTEALAMFSLGSVALMYLPVAGLVWARGGTAVHAAWVSAALCALIEFSKLFMQGTHADPTNLIVAVGTNIAAMAVLRLMQSLQSTPVQARSAGSGAAMQAALSPASSAVSARGSGSMLWLLVLPLAAGWAGLFPVFSVPLLGILLTAGLLVWRWPVLALGIIPAALPVLDWAPWSGRFFLDEFDLLQAVCVAIAWYRLPRQVATTPARRDRPVGSLVMGAFWVLGLSLTLSTLRALASLSGLDANSFSHYYSPFNALRIVKGAVWAYLFVCLWQRLQAQGLQRTRVFSAGMLLGLLLTLLFILAERSVFSGLMDFSADFRVTGPFSAMHKGGAYIECFLAVTGAFALAAALRPGAVAWRVAALVLVAGTAYAMLVTYSRNGYAALGVALVVSLAAAFRTWSASAEGRHGAPRSGSKVSGLLKQGAYAAVLLLVMAAVAWPVFSGRSPTAALRGAAASAPAPNPAGSYALQRLSQSGADLGVRQAHWEDGLALREGGWLGAVLGEGLGRFPERHFWRSREALRAASYRLMREGDVRFLRLGQGAALYIEQIVPRPEAGALRVRFDWRAAPGQPLPGVLLCEKWTLTSLGCAKGLARVTDPQPAATSTAWQSVEMTVDATPLLAGRSVLRAPLKLALVTPAQGTFDITKVQLWPADGTAETAGLLANGDFAQGMDRWFFATDVDPPWHLHSLPVAILFDQGWFGVLSWAALAGLVLWRGSRLLWQASGQVPAALPAVLAFAASGTLNTLVDAPRFLWLLLVLMWLAAAQQAARPASPQGAGGFDPQAPS